MHISNVSLFAVILLTSAAILQSPDACGLPIGFARTQGDLRYQELTNNNFRIYHDERTPGEAALTLRALEQAKPHMEHWLGVTRTRALPVIMSAVTDNASFANFITDAIELQTMGQASRDLAWHEYTHSMMYRHFDNYLGPAGAILHLPWMPAWWLEGLAEALSVSIGSDMHAGFERYHALSGDWPTYERLHSLYNKYNFVWRGYSTSGAFVAYILRKKPNLDLAQLHRDFFAASQPLRWPWAILPFAPSMPMDVALRKAFGMDGRELYEEYKSAATTYWRKHSQGELLSKRAVPRRDFGSIHSLQMRGDQVTYIYSSNNSNYEADLVFADKNIFATSETNAREIPNQLLTTARLVTKAWSLFVRREQAWQGEDASQLTVYFAGEDFVWATRPGYVSKIFETADNIAWIERQPETTRLCFAAKNSLQQRRALQTQQISCPTTLKLHDLDFIGSDDHWSQATGHNLTQQIYLRLSQQTHLGDRQQILSWTGDSDSPKPMNFSHGGRPLAYARSGETRWLLVGERNRRSVRRIDSNGQCLATLKIADTPLGILNTQNRDLLMTIVSGSRQHILRVDPNSIEQGPCSRSNGYTSPLLAAMRADRQTALGEAMQNSSTWIASTDETPIDLSTAPTLDKLELSKDREIKTTGPARWRGRPVAALPWVGADTGGYNFGILSVPLMDEMQNETLRLTALYGLESRFPSTEVSLTSTRFWPVITLDAFRYQSWNGIYRWRDDAGQTRSESLYYDERGVRLSTSLFLAPLNSSLGLGIKSSELVPIGRRTRSGQLNEPFVSVDHQRSIGSFNWSMNILARGAPASLNEEFAYDNVAVGTVLSRGFSLLRSSASLTLDGSRTRGPRRKWLQEVYRPLRTFVPGDGGGLNNLSIPLIGPGALFYPSTGDTQARAGVNWTFPLIPDLDTLVRLFYLERLDLTAFFNYGGAWRGSEPPDLANLIAAHGYNLDLLVDVKGLKFNTGAGVGQVLNNDWEAYITFGFDAIF